MQKKISFAIKNIAAMTLQKLPVLSPGKVHFMFVVLLPR